MSLQALPEPSGPVYPAAHLQEVYPPTPLEVDRSGQNLHAVTPVVHAYLPASHPLQPANDVTPVVVANFPKGQTMQSSDVVLPVDDKYVPATHETQVPVPRAACRT